MASWKDDLKFPLAQFHFRTLAFTVRDDDKLELQDQEQEEQLQRGTGLRFPRGLKNMTVLFQEAIGAPGSPMGTLLETDLFIDLNSESTLEAYCTQFDCGSSTVDDDYSTEDYPNYCIKLWQIVWRMLWQHILIEDGDQFLFRYGSHKNMMKCRGINKRRSRGDAW
jgi:hypothetical protein